MLLHGGLAVWVKDVAERQEDVTEELVGPSVKVAYKDGVATPAAMAFAKKGWGGSCRAEDGDECQG